MMVNPRRSARERVGGGFLGSFQSNGVQTPSFDFKRSFTACGLALPPEDFIT
jgi:hypothetical protein